MEIQNGEVTESDIQLEYHLCARAYVKVYSELYCLSHFWPYLHRLTIVPNEPPAMGRALLIRFARCVRQTTCLVVFQLPFPMVGRLADYFSSSLE